MATLLLTIDGPERRAELAAPAGTPIAVLLPTFLDLAAPGADPDPDAWTVSFEGSALADEQTLAAAGVGDGAILKLTPAEVGQASGGGSAPSRAGLLGRLQRVVGQEPDAAPAAGRRRGRRGSEQSIELDRAIQAPRLADGITLAIVSADRGAGRTLVGALLGSLLAHHREDRTIALALDGPDAQLGPLLAPDHGLYSDDLLTLLTGIGRDTAQLDAHLGRGPDGLRVVPAPPDPVRARRLDRRRSIELVEGLREHPGIVLLDCPAGAGEPAAQAAVTTADQLVLVSGPGQPELAATIETGKRLARSSVPFVLAVNRVPRRGRPVDPESLARRLPEAQAVVTIRDDPRGAERLAQGGFAWDEAGEPWRSDIRALAAALTRHWDELELRPARTD